MRHKIVFLEYILLAVGVMALEGCSRKADTNGARKADSVAQNTRLSDQNLSGTFEYSEPIEESYLYLKLEMKQTGDSLDGQLWSGIYLAKSNAGGFTNPTVLVECSLRGVKKDNPIEMQLRVTKTNRMEEDAPDLLGMMNFPELDTSVRATTWALNYENGALASQNGLLMPDGKSPVNLFGKRLNKKNKNSHEKFDSTQSRFNFLACRLPIPGRHMAAYR
jgi:hypothetical protein